MVLVSLRLLGHCPMRIRDVDPNPGIGRAERRVGREAAARVAALRENDYGEYLRLAQHTKDARLRTLLGKTDSIIAELGLKARRSLCKNFLAKALLLAKKGVARIRLA